MPESLLEKAAEAIELAKKAGAADAWARVTRKRATEVEMRDDLLEKVQESTSFGLGIQLWVNGRYSSSQTSDLRPESVQSFVTEAVALTRALEKDPFRQIPDPALFERRPETALELVDPTVLELSPEARIEICKATVAEARKHERIISSTVGVYDTHGLSASASSNGFEGTREYTSLWCGGEVTLRDEGDKRPEGSFYAGSTHVSDVPGPTDIGRRAREEAAQFLGAKKGPSEKTTMIVTPRAARRLLGHFLRSATARDASQGRSFWKHHLGDRALSRALTLTDEPLMPRAEGSRHFDGEGISAKSLPIVEAGVIRNLYVDTYYGRKIEMAPTTGSRSNLVVAPGKKGPDALLARVPKGILVQSWLGGNADGTTGDFSFGLRGQRIERGKITDPVSEMNVTGNLVTLFASLADVGNDPWPYGTTRAPTMVFKNVDLSGT